MKVWVCLVDQSVVKVLASKMSISSGRLDLENAFLDGKDEDIEGFASEVEDEAVALGGCLLFVESICNDGSGGLVDIPQNPKKK